MNEIINFQSDFSEQNTKTQQLPTLQDKQWFLNRIQNIPVFVASQPGIEVLLLCILQTINLVMPLIGYGRLNLRLGLPVMFDIGTMVQFVDDVLLWWGVGSTIMLKVTAGCIIWFSSDPNGHWELKFFRSRLRTIIFMDFLVSGLVMNLTHSNTVLLVINYSLSFFFMIFCTIFLENYAVTKDVLYASSCSHLLPSRICLGVMTYANLLARFDFMYSYEKVFWIIIQILVAITQSLLYLMKGYRTYMHALPRIHVLNCTSLHLSVIMVLATDQIFRLQLVWSEFLIHLGIAYTICFVAGYIFSSALVGRILKQNAEYSETLGYFLFRELQNSQIANGTQQRALLAGLLRNHADACRNPSCYCLKKLVYDRRHHCECNTDNLVAQRSALIKFMIKCGFQTNIMKHSHQQDTVLSFAEFLFLRLDNSAQALLVLKTLKKEKMPVFNKLRLHRLIKMMKSSLGSTIGIENVIQGQSIYSSGRKLSHQLLKIRKNIWEYLALPQIDLSLLKGMVTGEKDKSKQASEVWLKLTPYFRMQSKWKLHYLCHHFYLLNERVRAKSIDDLFPEENLKNSLLKDRLFGRDSCCIHASSVEGELQIKNVSNQFSSVFGRDCKEVVNASLAILLPPSLRQRHSARVKEWIQTARVAQGELTSSDVPAVSALGVDGAGYLLRLEKNFKHCVSAAGQLEFVCLVGLAKAQHSILCNAQLEIEAVTRSLPSELKLEVGGEHSLRGLNLRSILGEIPAEPCSFEAELCFCSNLEEYADFTATAKKKSKADEKAYETAVLHVKELIRDQNQSLPCHVNFKRIDFDSKHMFLFTFLDLHLKDEHCDSQDRTDFSLAQSTTNLNKTFHFQSNAAMNGKAKLLTNSDNIFLKEQANEPLKYNRIIQAVKFLLRVLFLLLASGELLRTYLLHQSLITVQNNCKSLNNTMFLFKIPFVLSNYYYMNILNISSSNNLSIASRIKYLTAGIYDIFNSQIMRQAIYDPKVNTKNKYLPLNGTPAALPYDQIDMIYLMQSLMTTLSTEQHINPANSRQYQQFMGYLYPGFCNLVNVTKYNIHDNFQGIYDKIDIIDSTFSSFQSILALLSIGLNMFLIVRFNKNMTNVMKLHTQFSTQQIDNVKEYYQHLQNVFSSFLEEERKVSKKSLTAVLAKPKIHVRKMTEIDNANLNKKAKTVVQGKVLSREVRLYIVKLIITVALCVGTCVSAGSYMKSLLEPVKKLELDGYTMMKNYPTTTVAGTMIAQNYYLNLTGGKFNYSLYNNQYANMLSSKNKAYIGDPYANTPFYVRQKRYYYTNICQEDKEGLHTFGLSVSICETICNGSFSRGITSFLGYEYWLAHRVLKQNQTLPLTLVGQLLNALQIHTVMNDDVVLVWAQELSDRMEDILKQLTYTSSAALILTILVWIGTEIWIISRLSEDYNLYRHLYQSMMPESVVSTEKTIKSKLSVLHFLPN